MWALDQSMERGLEMIETQEQLISSIEQQLDNLSYVNQMLFDYWLNELCDENDELIPAKCSEEILSQLEKDVYDNEV
jgi:hypothetical protein